MDKTPAERLSHALWRIYNRPERPLPWGYGGNLPYDDPAFSERMLELHLDESHGAATRNATERAHQIEWMWDKLDLKPGDHLLDVTCGPGLYAIPYAQRGLRVTGIDFGPAAIRTAERLAAADEVSDQCRFIEADIRQFDYPEQTYDAAILLYGQLAVMSKEEADGVLQRIAKGLKPGGRLLVEMLHQDRVDRENSSWWFTDDGGLWGDGPFLHLGERIWYPDESLSIERYQIVHLETGEIDEILLGDQTYSTAAFSDKMKRAPFFEIEVIEEWGQLPLADRHEWVVFIGETEKASR